jgi:hypothetical protein
MHASPTPFAGAAAVARRARCAGLARAPFDWELLAMPLRRERRS